jgi:hypothetical protein
MADHFYSVAAEGQTMLRDPSLIVVGTSATGANPIELRVTDGALTHREVYAFLEYLADLFVRTESNQKIAAGTLKG